MAVRSPLKYNGSQLQEMTTAEVLEYTKLAIYYYSLNPTVTLSVSSSSGNLTSINDTRLHPLVVRLFLTKLQQLNQALSQSHIKGSHRPLVLLLLHLIQEQLFLYITHQQVLSRL